MTDILRNNWFVVLIAIIIIGFIGYFIYDTNKDNVSAKTTNNEQVVASINKDDITADDLYDESTPYDGSTIYNMYKNAVIDQSIKTTKDLKKQASTLESNIKSNASSQSDDYESTLTTELAKYGYASYEELNDYCLTSVKEKEMNMNEIAARLQITNGALTSHIRKLEEAGLIRVTQDSVGHGNQKVCSVLETRILVEIGTQEETDEGSIFRAEIPVGQYSDYQVFPTCGISTTKKMIGEVDDPRYFAHPDRAEAGILWLSKGYVEYLVPNILPAGQKIDELTFTMEISSEAPGFNNDWPSDITFLLNDTPVGVWTSPGDFGDRHGLFTPNWWFSGWNQYGLLKMLVIDQNGTYIDGMKISDVSTTQLQLDYKSQIRLKFAVQEDAAHVGGMTLFGSGFGNYSQGIRVRMRYSPMEKGNE